MGVTVAVSYLDERFAAAPERLSVAQLAELLIVDHGTAYKWLKAGLIPATQMGRSWLIYRDEVLAALKADRALRAQSGLEDDDPEQGEQQL